MSSSNQPYTGLESDHGDKKNNQAGQSAQGGMATGAVSVDHNKSGGSSGDLGDSGKDTTTRHVHK